MADKIKVICVSVGAMMIMARGALRTQMKQIKTAMKITNSGVHFYLALTLAISAENANAAKDGQGSASTIILSAAGKTLEAQYTQMLNAERAEISRLLPGIDAEKASLYRKAYADEAVAQSAYEATYKHQGHSVVVDDSAKEAAAQLAKAKEEAYAQAKLRAIQAVKAIFADVGGPLSEDVLDSHLVKCAVLVEATPAGLAEFAQKGKAEEDLVTKLLADKELMKEMLVAGGARGGQYGRAMQIYMGIRQASNRAGQGVLQRLALGTSLEQAAPGVNNERFQIDPVKRYLTYEKAYLAGELDPAFPTMNTWECRMITDEPNSDEDLAWYREMLKNYRPDHVYNPDYRWRYSRIVRTDVPYKDPLPEQGDGTSRIQQLLCGGGKCGPRAFVGRIALRSFGIPTWGVQQPGHAALAHWTPQGWTINLGAGWQYSTWEGRSGTDFLLEAQARAHPKDYLKVLRAQWIGDALAEEKVNPAQPGLGGFWNALALTEKEMIVAEGKPVQVELAGEDLAEATASKKAESISLAKITDEDRRVAFGPNGVVTIPAAACSEPKNNTKGITFMRSFLGGMQMNASGSEAFEYAFEMPAAGRYELVARVVTVHKDQQLNFDTGAGKPRVGIPLPYTVGKWQETRPVIVALSSGMNTLRFAGAEKSLGFTIKDFTLTPLK